MTLLEAVQICLQSSGSFEIQSIFDTDESERTAYLAREVFDIISDKSHELQHQMFSGTLEGLSDTRRPNYLRVPDAVLSVQDSTIRYMTGLDNYGEYKTLTYLSNQAFLEYVQTRNINQPDTDLIEDPGGAKYVIKTNANPRYWTSFDGEHVACDSYDSSRENTLLENRSLIIGQKSSEFLLEDNFEIPLPAHLISGFKDVLKNEYYEQIIEEAKPSISRRANAFLAKLQQSNRRIGEKQRNKPRYGRR